MAGPAPAGAEASSTPRNPPRFVDLGELARQGLPRELPSVAPVWPDKCLLYAGRLNETHGEPGVGKTNVACAFGAVVAQDGGTVLYLDPEDTPQGIAARLLSFGLTDEQLTAHIRYLHNPAPEDYLDAIAWAQQTKCALAILDGLAKAMAAEGYNEDVAGDVLAFFRSRMRPFAEAGAAVLVSDHVAKSTESRGRWARGSGAKMGRYDGVSYLVNLGEAYGREKAGYVRLSIAKDRLGGVGMLHQEVADLYFTPDGEQTRLEWRSPASPAGVEHVFKPTKLMEKVSARLRMNPDATLRELRTLGKNKWVDDAIVELERGGFLKVTKHGPGKGNEYELLKLYTEGCEL